MKKIHYLVVAFISMSAFIGCKKDWLNAKPNIALVVPTSVEDYQLLLNNRAIFGVNMPSMTDICAGDYYLSTAVWQSTNSFEKNAYIWADDIYEGQNNPDWTATWKQILQANIVLDGLENLPIDQKNSQQYNSTKGQALFYRAWCYYNLAMMFCKPYSSTANTDQGLPYRIKPDVNQKPQRGVLKQLYDNIIKDFNEAHGLLPETQQYKTQPTKLAVSAALSRLYLSIADYDHASIYARQCLETNADLLDYNSIDTTKTYPIPLFNEEVIWHAESALYGTFPSLSGIPDTTLFKSYDSNDLRKALFFGPGPNGRRFTGMYTGNRVVYFAGLAMDEIYLIEAECLVRKGSIDAGIGLLNKLMENRYLKKNDVSTFVPYSSSNETEAMRLVLLERRKELIMRNVRWSDLRRLNKDERFKVTLKRVLGTQVFELPPNAPNYTILLPPDEIRNGGMEQTIR